ncbi:hypothetical protein STEG23_011775 [Scotinomys teguina]
MWKRACPAAATAGKVKHPPFRLKYLPAVNSETNGQATNQNGLAHNDHGYCDHDLRYFSEKATRDESPQTSLSPLHLQRGRESQGDTNSAWQWLRADVRVARPQTLMGPRRRRRRRQHPAGRSSPTGRPGTLQGSR